MLIFYVIYPFIRLVQTALGDPGGWSNVGFFFSNTANVFVVQITFRDAAIVTLIDVVAGGVMAWALRSARSRLMRFALLSAIFVPFWMGSVVKIYAFTALLGRAGVINTCGATSPPWWPAWSTRCCRSPCSRCTSPSRRSTPT